MSRPLRLAQHGREPYTGSVPISNGPSSECRLWPASSRLMDSGGTRPWRRRLCMRSRGRCLELFARKVRGQLVFRPNLLRNLPQGQGRGVQHFGTDCALAAVPRIEPGPIAASNAGTRASTTARSNDVSKSRQSYRKIDSDQSRSPAKHHASSLPGRDRQTRCAPPFAESFNFAIEAITTLSIVRAAKTI